MVVGGIVPIVHDFGPSIQNIVVIFVLVLVVGIFFFSPLVLDSSCIYTCLRHRSGVGGGGGGGNVAVWLLKRIGEVDCVCDQVSVHLHLILHRCVGGRICG